MKRYRLIAAVGAVAMFTAVLSGSSAYGGSSEAAQGSAIKLGVLTPLTATSCLGASRSARERRSQ